MPNRTLKIDVVVDGSGKARQALGSISGSVKQAGTAAKGASPAFAGMAASAARMAAGAVAFGKISALAKESLALFSAQEDAINGLNTALATQGGNVDLVSGQYQQMASNLQGLTTFGDEAFIAMQSLLVQIGDVGPGQMEAALRASADLATGLGIDLRSATLLVGKAFAGETGSLTRYGIVLDDATKKSGDMGLVLDAITDKFGGQAQAAAQTFSGQVTQLGNSWGDLKESLGAVLVPLIQRLLPAIQRGIAFFQNLSPEVRTAVVVVGGLSAAILALAPIVAAIGLAIGAIATGPIALVVGAIVGLTAAWVAWGDDITRIVGNTVTAIRGWLVDKFNAIVGSVKEKIDAVTGFFGDMFDAVVGGSIVPDLINGIGMEFSRLEDVMVAPAQQALSGLTESFQGWADNLGGMMGGMFGAGGILSGIMTGGMSTIMSSLSGLAITGLKKIGGAFKQLFGGPSAKELAGREIVEEFQGNMADMLTGQQQVEAGGELWKATNIAVRDSYLAVGLSEREALADVQKLYDGIKQGPSTVNPQIELIRSKMGELRGEIDAAAGAFATLANQQRAAGDFAGSLASNMAARDANLMAGGGSGVVNRPTLFMAGEGGPERFSFTPGRGGGGGGGGLTVNINGGIFNTPQSMQALAREIQNTTLRTLQRQRQI